MAKTYWFIQRDSKLDLLGRESSHWSVCFDLNSKEEVRKTFSRGTRYVKTGEIFTPKQLIEKYSNKQIRTILEEIKRYHPDKFRKN